MGPQGVVDTNNLGDRTARKGEFVGVGEEVRTGGSVGEQVEERVLVRAAEGKMLSRLRKANSRIQSVQGCKFWVMKFKKRVLTV